MLHLAFRSNYNLMHLLSERVISPVRETQARISGLVPFSIAELLIAIALLWVICMILRKKWKGLFTGLGTLCLAVYALFCILWGTYYYGEAPYQAEKISTEQLSAVTRYFASMANEHYTGSIDRNEVLEKSAELYGNQGIRAKGIMCSKVMSLLDFTGFFSPFTAEANVNMDSPAQDLPATVAHEIAHLHGVAREQEANFYAVRACLEYGHEEYVYSASLLAYTYLGNALCGENYDEWLEIYRSLSDEVRADLKETNDYWENYRTPVKEVSNTVYENFLFSYGQDLGLKSYGACVDLVVNYYYDEAVKTGMD